MDRVPMNPKRRNKSRYNNIIRESDVHADPEYKKKKEFFDQLFLSVQMNCNILRENAIKEANSVRDNLSLMISQLPKRIQAMKVSDFCKEFGFELSDGNLYASDEVAENTKTQRIAPHTVTTDRSLPQSQTMKNPSKEVLSQLQIVRNVATSEPSLRLIKNSTTYDLSNEKMKTYTPRERELIQAEVVAFTKLLQNTLSRS